MNKEKNKYQSSILEKIYLLNKKDLNKKNDNLIKIITTDEIVWTAINKVISNPGASAEGTEKQTPDGYDKYKLEKLTNSIRTGKYKWKTIKQVEIAKPGKKKKRPIGIANFEDKIVQELIRIILTVIYEPLFQMIETNHGNRPNRSTKTAVNEINRKSQGIYTAIEGDISNAYNSTNYEILLEMLKEKITDKKFLKLIETGLKQKVLLPNKKIKTNEIGMTQGSGASPILFNIYMHKFDLWVLKYLEETMKNKNKQDNRIDQAENKIYARYRSQITSKTRTFNRLNNKKLNNKISQIEDVELKEIIKTLRKLKKKRFRIESIDHAKKTLFAYYFRFVDDWIIISNCNEQLALEIKNEIKKWLKINLELELDKEKTLITNLNKEKAKFLGFTIYNNKQKKITTRIRKGRPYRQRLNIGLAIGVDHQRIKKRLIERKVINRHLKPIRIPWYISLKPAEIVKKFRQRIEGLIQYYYNNITYKTSINFYYYIYKYSCLKTLANRLKKSIKKIAMIYGTNIVMPYEIKKIKDKRWIKETKYEHYPTLKEILTDNNKRFNETEKQKAIYLSKIPKNERKTSDYLPNITVKSIKEYKSHLEDPINDLITKVNLRSGKMLYSNCAICGCKGTRKIQFKCITWNIFSKE